MKRLKICLKNKIYDYVININMDLITYMQTLEFLLIFQESINNIIFLNGFQILIIYLKN